MFTTLQIAAIITLLQAFGVNQATIDQVRVEISPTAITIAPMLQNSPAPAFGSISSSSPSTVVNVPPPPVSSPVVAPPVVVQAPEPQWSILVSVSSSTPQSKNGMSRMSVSVYDPNGVYQKMPVTVTTNDPDLPPSFTFNADPHKINFFCVAPVYPASGTNMGFPDAGCLNESPVSVGTFDFTFSAENTTVAEQITVLPYGQ